MLAAPPTNSRDPANKKRHIRPDFGGNFFQILAGKPRAQKLVKRLQYCRRVAAPAPEPCAVGDAFFQMDSDSKMPPSCDRERRYRHANKVRPIGRQRRIRA